MLAKPLAGLTTQTLTGCSARWPLWEAEQELGAGGGITVLAAVSTHPTCTP